MVEGRFKGTKLDLSINLDVPEQAAVVNELNRINSSQAEPQRACFIATAAYGSEMEPSVVELRRFRDSYLQRHVWGRGLIAVYKRTSPALAREIETSEWRKWIVRKLLLPVVFLATVLNSFSPRK